MCPTYVWSCEKGCGDLEVYRSMADYRVPPDHEHPVTRVITAAYAISDIAPYKAVTGDKAGQEIRGRKQHREFLKRNRLVEVGDAPVRDTRQMRPTIKKGAIARELKRAIAQHTVPDLKRGGLRERHGG